MQRTLELQKFVEKMAPVPEAFNRPNTCAVCGGEALNFRDSLSIKEFTISRMCQECQDGIFGS